MALSGLTFLNNNRLKASHTISMLLFMLLAFSSHFVYGQNTAQVHLLNPPENEISSSIQKSVNNLVHLINNNADLSEVDIDNQLTASEQFVTDLNALSREFKLSVEKSSHFLQWAILSDGQYELRGLPIMVKPDNVDTAYQEIAVITIDDTGFLKGIRWSLEQNRYQK
jgi:hypothetical protein